MRGLLVLGLATAALVAGLAQAGSAQQALPEPLEGGVPTTLFLHVNDFQDMPMNTQAPPEGFAEDVTVGLVTPSTSCVATGPVLQAYEHHTHRGFGLLGHMDYAQRPARPVHEDYGMGLLSDVHLVGDGMVLHWYWSTEASDPFDAGAQLPLVLPDVTVEATLREGGQTFGIDEEAADHGAIIAQGRSAPATLAGEQSNGATYEMVGSRHVYHFEVPLTIERPVIPSALGYNLRVDTYVLRDGCPSGGYLTPNLLALHTSLDHRPRLELVASDRPSVDIVYAGPRSGPNATEGPPGGVVIHADVSSAWGKHDIASIEMAITGPGEVYSVARLEAPVMAHCHCPPTPLQATWLWDAAYDKAPAGRYEVTVTATNLQGTATTVGMETFDLRYEKPAPAPAAPWLLAGLAAAVLALGRRR